MGSIMPFMLVLFVYIVLEGLAFVGVSQLIGVGWTLLLLLATMLFGMTIASLEVRRIMHGKTTRTEDGSVIMEDATDRKSTRLNSSHVAISYAVFCLKKKNNTVCHNNSHTYTSST